MMLFTSLLAFAIALLSLFSQSLKVNSFPVLGLKSFINA
ncbi:hypothetical protein V6Z11_A11G266100 [Gossypium hirsutum]